MSRRIALSLLKAGSVEDIQEVLKDSEAKDWFNDPQHWSPYGNRDKNWDTVGNQQSKPVGGLVEIITNGIDSILLRKAKEDGLSDMRSEKAPQSMFEAVKRYFPHVVEGKIGLLEPGQRIALAKECIQIGVRRPHRKNHPYPSYTIVDFGEGQLPADFPKTFLSLSEKNKEGIPFVQGKFNMGSTGSIRFCTRADIRLGHYKLIVSRRHGQEYWGWTLIRIRDAREGEGLPVTEYFHPYGNNIPKFEEDSISAFQHDTLGRIEEGSIVKLYEYDIGPGARAVDVGLYDALTVNLIDCALPVHLVDFNAEPVKGKGPLRAEGIADRAFGGLNVVLRSDRAETKPNDNKPTGNYEIATEGVHLIADIRDEELGRFKILATPVTKLKDVLKKQPARIFYTINGQTHAIERASFLNQKVNLNDIRNHIIINIVCDEMSKQALATIFMPDRERKANNELSRLLEKKVVDEIKGDEKLRLFAREIRFRRASEKVEDKQETKDLLQSMVNSDPTIKELFGLGGFLPEVVTGPRGTEPFKGKEYPTFLKPLNLREEGGVFVKDVPVEGYRRIECGTDAGDQYLTRVNSPGETWCSLDASQLPHTVKLRNRIARFTLHAPKTAAVGDEVMVEFGFVDYGPNVEPLKFKVLVRFSKAEQKVKNPGGKRTGTKKQNKPNVGEPDFRWVCESDWNDHGFDEESAAYVDTGETTIVYINSDNCHLTAMRAKVRDEAERLLNENMFKLGLGLFALAIHKKASSRETDETGQQVDAEEHTRMATSGMAPYIVTVIRRLGGN